MKEKPAILAKVTRPIFSNGILRERLFKKLDRIRRRPAIWVSGPAGCGKTTLVTSYIESQDLPCLWYQIDSGDTDPATFFYYMGLAVKQAAPRKRKPLPLLTPEYLLGIPTFAQRYFENVCGRLKIPSVLVFDNYQEVASNALFHEVIRHGLSAIPEGINVIIISREPPPPVMTRLGANNLMETLGWNEIRLTEKETEEIALLQSPENLSKETIKRLHTSTDGWAAGLVLMLERAKTEGVAPDWVGKFTPEEIFDYFAGEIFMEFEDKIKRFLLKTAFLPYMTIKMAEKLTGLGNAGHILSRFYRSHLFTERRFHKKISYQYHPLFREFLINRAKETLSQEDLTALLRESAIALKAEDETEDAVALLHDAEDWNALVQLIMEQAPSMLEQGRNHALEKWLESLPKEMMNSIPWLLYWMGACQFPFNPSSSQLYFEQAFEDFNIQQDTAGIFLAWSGIVESISLSTEDLPRLDQWITILENLIHELKTFPSLEVEARVASAMITALTQSQLHHPEIETWAKRALLLTENMPNINIKTFTLFHLAFYRVCRGEVEKAKLAVDALGQLSTFAEAPPLTQISARLAEAMYYNFMAMHEKCLKAVSEGLGLSKTSGVHILDHVFLIHCIWSALNVNDLAMAGDLIGKHGPLNSLKSVDKTLFHLLRSLEALFRRDFSQAVLHVDLSMQTLVKVGTPFSLILGHLSKALIMHEMERHKEAAKHLDHALGIAKLIKSNALEFNALMIGALFSIDQQKLKHGLKELRTALTLGKKHGYLNLMVDHPPSTARLCVKALEEEIEIKYVQQLIQKRNLVPDTPPIHLENWPWSIKIFTMGRFLLIKNEKPVKFPVRSQRKPLEMINVLLSFGGRDVGKERICDALWPDADGDKANQVFATTLHRLRQLLGNDKAILLQEGKLSLNSLFCWVDTWAFERMLTQAEKASGEGNKNTTILLLEKAVSLYRGHFLASEQLETWSISHRERVRSKFRYGIDRLGTYYEEAKDLDRAVSCFKRGLDVDDLAEELYQRLMLCLKRLGKNAEALAVYDRCKRSLSTTLQRDPSPETKDIHNLLLTSS